MLFTAQSGRLVCLETARGRQRWSQPAEVHGHSSPAVDTACGHCAAADSGEEAQAVSYTYEARVAVVGAVDGTVHAFDAGDGTPLGAARLGAPIFSSPLFCAGRLVIGCRDDGLHCLALVRSRACHSGPRRAGGTRTRTEAEIGAVVHESEPTYEAAAIDERRLAAQRRVALLREGGGSTSLTQGRFDLETIHK